ncbi:MAG TPA: radical SAM protein [bacterium]|nr:radical SAM protein [bacterium]HQO36060.1 radical SAM protein [bacterium]HQP98916.1 radical SAM protein [bacterium]
MSRVLLISLFDEYALGIRYLAAALSDAGHDAQLAFFKELATLQECLREPEDLDFIPSVPFPVSRAEIGILVEEAVRYQPDLVGISLVSNLHGLAIEITRAVRDRLRVPVVWGGVDPTINPDLAEDHADVICIGEGERAIVELADSIGRNRRNGDDPLSTLSRIENPIDNLRIRRPDGWLSDRVGVMIPDLDTLPFPLFDLSRECSISEERLYRACRPPLGRLPRLLPVISFRGCPYHCHYCCHSVLKKIYTGGKYLRRRSVSNVIEELRLRKRQFPALRMIEIEDDVFTLDQGWIDEFCREYKQHIGIPFWCYTYPGISRESMLKPLKEAGLSSVTFGIQSGSQRILTEVYGRPVRAEKILETADVLRRLDIPFVVDLIGGNPLETDADRIETVKVLAALPKPYLLHPINPLSFYRNLPITERAIQAGVRLAPSPGANKFGPEPDARLRAWDALLTLAHYPGIEADTLRPFWENERLMMEPKLLEQLADALAQATYHDGNIYETKSVRIGIEQERNRNLAVRINELERELGMLYGSRLVRWANRLRQVLECFRSTSDTESAQPTRRE